MLVTFKNLVRASLRCIQDFGPGYSPNQSKQEDALFVFNAMIDRLQINRLNIPGIVGASYPLTQGKQKYTIGPTAADITAPRPLRIEDANLIILDNPSQPLRRPLKILSTQQFSQIKLQLTQSTIPEWIYFDDGYNAGAGTEPDNLPTGNGTLYLYPVPSIANEVELFTWGPLSLVPNIGASLDYQPGYLEMLYLQLAVRLASQWGKELRSDVAKLAAEALEDVQAHNAPTPMMRCDMGVLSADGPQNAGDFNYVTGDLN